MKRDVRFLGIDDSPFHFADERAAVVAVVTRGAGYIEGVLTDFVEVDGDDATHRLLGLVRRTRFRPLIRAVFLNGVTLAGFNVVDLDALHDDLGVPVVSVVRTEPRLAKVRAALEKHFPDAAIRQKRLDALRPSPTSNGGYKLWATTRGVPPQELPSLLASATIRGAIPEPIRLAHVIAGGFTRGESRGPA